MPTFTFKSASFTVKWAELLTFTMETRSTVARENRVALLGLLTMKTRPKDTFTCENGLDLLDLLDMQGGRTASTHGGRGRTNADGRGCHGLLNMGFFNKANAGRIGRRRELLAMRFKSTEGRKGLRGSGMGLLALFFTFKSKTSSEREAFAWA